MKTLYFLLGIFTLSFVLIRPIQAQEQVLRNWNLAELLEVAAFDIDLYWQAAFAENGLRYRQPQIILFDTRSIQTRCGVSSSQIGPFYCSYDHTIYLPSAFMQNQLDEIGDFAVVLILAHEWSHAVQAQAQTLESALSIYAELQADCFARAYSYHAAFESEHVTLDPGDLEEGALTLFLAGDTHLSWFDPQAHGTGRQRVTAYSDGFDGTYEACLED